MPGARSSRSNETLAKSSGALLGRSRTTDVVAASVVLGAAKRGDEILTIARDDLGALASVMKRVGVIDMRGLPAKWSPRRKRR